MRSGQATALGCVENVPASDIGREVTLGHSEIVSGADGPVGLRVLGADDPAAVSPPVAAIRLLVPFGRVAEHGLGRREAGDRDAER